MWIMRILNLQFAAPVDNFLPCAARPIRMKRPPLPPGIIGYKSGSIASNQIPLRFESKRPTFAKRIKITETETCKDASGLQPMEDVYRNSGKDSVLRDGQAVEKGEAATSVVESTSDAAGKQNQELVDQFDGIALKGHSLRSQFVGLGSSKGIVCKVHPDLQDRGTPAQYQCSGRTDNVSHFPEDREPRHHSRLHTLRNKQPLKILNEYAAKRSCQLAQVNLIHRESANPRLSPQKNVSIQSPILCLNHFKVQGSKCQHRHDAVLVTTMPSLFNNSDPPPEQLGGIEEFEFGLKPSGDRQVGKVKMANSQKLSCLNTFEACKSNFELQGKIHGAERQAAYMSENTATTTSVMEGLVIKDKLAWSSSNDYKRIREPYPETLKQMVPEDGNKQSFVHSANVDQLKDKVATVPSVRNAKEHYGEAYNSITSESSPKLRDKKCPKEIHEHHGLHIPVPTSPSSNSCHHSGQFAGFHHSNCSVGYDYGANTSSMKHAQFPCSIMRQGAVKALDYHLKESAGQINNEERTAYNSKKKLDITSVLSLPWIQRWCRSYQQDFVPNEMNLASGLHGSAIDSFPFRSLPSAAAMAIVGIAARKPGYRKLQKKGSLSVWKTEGFHLNSSTG
eukprot:TRINITY_DN2347_c0_g1_i2.p1 TRINITY_DN2347_c0_g1~~TRINITY_DN2347_c0_g1_i2.p1  ORF type:complete len:620 (+),score=117.66 TRINITY_DN2347_c0_g1_i2:851-2710(+)